MVSPSSALYNLYLSSKIEGYPKIVHRVCEFWVGANEHIDWVWILELLYYAFGNWYSFIVALLFHFAVTFCVSWKIGPTELSGIYFLVYAGSHFTILISFIFVNFVLIRWFLILLLHCELMLKGNLWPLLINERIHQDGAGGTNLWHRTEH